jgi:hypothetical protein
MQSGARYVSAKEIGREQHAPAGYPFFTVHLADSGTMVATGYLSSLYAGSLREFGQPIYLPNAGGWLIERPVPATSLKDGMGCYPVFCCENWNRLAGDIRHLSHRLVSVVLITDPFAEVDVLRLKDEWTIVVPYKKHYVINTDAKTADFVSKSHNHHSMRALRQVSVEMCLNPTDYLDDWCRLYQVLSRRHSIKGLRCFSRRAFEAQLATPGMVMFKATMKGEVVGLDLWYVQEDVARGHLAAYTEAGYELRVSYALKWAIIDYFRDRVAWIDLGAGRLADQSDGLSAFKKGYANDAKQTWLCGFVLRPTEYEGLSALSNRGTSIDYFPKYRMGEFA